MQQRFCFCGATVWVRYFFANTRWLTFFYHGDDRERDASACPSCGRKLDIENLR